jgi:hypothetical protein
MDLVSKEDKYQLREREKKKKKSHHKVKKDSPLQGFGLAPSVVFLTLQAYICFMEIGPLYMFGGNTQQLFSSRAGFQASPLY